LVVIWSRCSPGMTMNGAIAAAWLTLLPMSPIKGYNGTKHAYTKFRD